MLLISGAGQKQFVEFDDDLLSLTRQKETITVVMAFNIQEGYHIQDVSEIKDNLIATEISFENHDAYSILNRKFTVTNYETVVLNEFTHRVLSDVLEVTLKLNLKNKSSDPELKLKGQLIYQACDDRQCYFPRTLNFVITL